MIVEVSTYLAGKPYDAKVSRAVWEGDSWAKGFSPMSKFPTSFLSMGAVYVQGQVQQDDLSPVGPTSEEYAGTALDPVCGV